MNNSNTTQEYIQLTGNLTAKELKDTELVALHKGLFELYIKEKIKKLDIRNTVLKIYDQEVNKDNIRLYYNRKISIFTQALVQGELESIVKHQTF